MIGQKENREKAIKKVKEIITEAYKVMYSDPRKCIELSKKALLLSRDNDFKIGIGMAFLHIGLGYFHQSNYFKALHSYLKAEPILKKAQFWYGLRSAYNNIGLVYHQWNDLERALEYYNKDLELEEKFNDPKLSSTILNNMGRIYLNLKDYDKAIEYFQQSISVCCEYELPHMKSVAMDNLGTVYLMKGRYTKAENIFNKAKKIKMEIKDHAGINQIFQNLALLYKEKQEYDPALNFLDNALIYAKKIEEQNQIAQIYFHYAEIYEKLEDFPKQYQFLQKSLKIAEPNEYRAIMQKVYIALADYFEHSQDYKFALIYRKKIEKLNAFFSDEKKNQAIQEIKIRMEVQRTEREKAILQKQNKELETKNILISRQKEKLEKTEKKLKELNQNLEQRVQEEIVKRRKQEKFVIQKSKLESLGQMAAGIAHEINQPIGLIKIAAQNLFHKFEQNKINSKYLQEKSDFIDQNIKRINNIIEHIRLFSRDQKETKQKFNIAQTIKDALSMISTQCKNHNIKIITEIASEEYFTLGNRYRFEQVLLNLLSNAKDALDEKFDEFDDAKIIIIRLYKKAEKIILEVEDNGIGFDKNVLESAFDPFFTTKNEHKGTGLGLSISYGIVSEMQGKISLHSRKGEFTVARIELIGFERERKVESWKLKVES